MEEDDDETQDEEEKVSGLFDALDTDSSGALDWDEIDAFFNGVNNGKLSGEQAQAALDDHRKEVQEQIDTDGNGKVSRDEWHSYIGSVYPTRAERAALFDILEAQGKLLGQSPSAARAPWCCGWSAPARLSIIVLFSAC